jgi:hypothetical protein
MGEQTSSVPNAVVEDPKIHVTSPISRSGITLRREGGSIL